MISVIIYLVVLILELLFFVSFAVFTIFLIYSSVKGSPYVPTKNKQVNLILEKAKLKKSEIFLDLGCGDGRVVRTAVKNFQVTGIGIEINPLLLIWAKILSGFQRLKNIDFFRLDIIKENLPKADVIYIFLMPKLIAAITPKLKKHLDQGALIISHGFKIKRLIKYFRYKIDQNPFPTYFYKLKSDI